MVVRSGSGEGSGVRVGRYRLTERIAVGGMGEVHLARYRNAAGDECVAVVKRILPNLCSDPDFVAYFEHEGRVSSLLSHPNVVQTLELGRAAERYFIAMEYVPGPTLVRLLATALKRQRQLSVPLVVHICLQLAAAVAYIHSRCDLQGRPFSIIHMDLAPHNVLVTPEGAVKVLDFGIARTNRLLPVKRRRDLRGRTAYLAPEQLHGLPLDQRVDIFALGVIMHELVVGRPLFRAREDHQTVNRILYAPIPHPRRQRPDCPELLERAILKALKRDRDARYQSATELKHDLDRCVEVHRIVRSDGALQAELAQLMEQAKATAPAGEEAEDDSTSGVGGC